MPTISTSPTPWKPTGARGAVLAAEGPSHSTIILWLKERDLRAIPFLPADIMPLIDAIDARAVDWVITPEDGGGLDLFDARRLIVALARANAEIWVTDHTLTAMTSTIMPVCVLKSSPHDIAHSEHLAQALAADPEIDTAATSMKSILLAVADVHSNSSDSFTRYLRVTRLPITTPQWNGTELWYCGHLVKRFRKPAENQKHLLTAFKQQGWPKQIRNPWIGLVTLDKAIDTLRCAVDGLKRDHLDARLYFATRDNYHFASWSATRVFYTSLHSSATLF